MALKDAEARRAYNRAYRQANRERLDAYQAEYRQARGHAPFGSEEHREKRRKALGRGAAHRNWRPLEDRFWAKVRKGEGCWEWTGSTSLGYGRIRLGEGRSTVPAHRVSYEMFKGPIPEGLELDHLCFNHGCVNPAHLEAVTHAENMRRYAQR